MTTVPRTAVAVEPRSARQWLDTAVAEGGGTVVAVAEAGAVVWTRHDDPDGLDRLLTDHPQVEWVQLPFAGIEPYVDVVRGHRDLTWTCGKGVYSEPVAEHALAMALAGLRHLAGYARETEWSKAVGVNLIGARVVILGGGGIATSLLRLLFPFRCHTTVVRRTAEPVQGADQVVTLDALDGALAGADVVFLALALTPETTGIIDRRRLEMLAPHAWVVNVARGRHIVTDDLVTVLSEGRIGGAALDVTDPEPLPPGHPLWSEPRCLITPHTANTIEMAVPILSERVRENVRRWIAGESLVGPVDVDAGY